MARLAGEPGLRLAALAEQDDVLAGEDGVLDLRDDGLLVADEQREEGLARAHLLDEVLAHLLLDREDAVAARSKLADRLRLVGLRHVQHSPRRAYAC